VYEGVGGDRFVGFKGSSGVEIFPKGIDVIPRAVNFPEDNADTGNVGVASFMSLWRVYEAL
jgi:hypothetical protein